MATQKRGISGGTVVAFIALLAGGFLFLHTFDSRYVGLGIGAKFGPVFYPRILLGLWILVAGLILAAEIRKPDVQLPPLNWPALIRVLAVMGLAVWSIQAIGFLLASIFFSSSYAWIMGHRRPIPIVLVGVMFPIGAWYLFHHILMIRLPVNIWLGGV